MSLGTLDQLEEALDEVEYWKAKYLLARQTGYAEGKEELLNALQPFLDVDKESLRGNLRAFILDQRRGIEEA